MPASISSNWFREIIEPLADSFDPEDVRRYVDLFATTIQRRELIGRYERIRHERTFDGPDPKDVFVLSRVTLGADVAITSVALAAVLQRFPHARVWFVGSRKNFRLFEKEPRLSLLEVPYQRHGTLADRLDASDSLRTRLDRPESIVVDPDSRLSQLGLIPVCEEASYYFFESRGAVGPGSLTGLAQAWVARTFGVSEARNFVAVQPSGQRWDVAVSLGVGGNPDKRVRDPFERELLSWLSRMGREVVVDEGAGGEETERVIAAAQGIPNVRTWRGDFADFASIIASSDLYIGYDSAGQHVAAACGTPLVTVFSGFPNERFLERWTPEGPGRTGVVRVDAGADPSGVLDRVARLIDPRP